MISTLIIQHFFIFVGLWFTTLVFHEYGHWIYFKVFLQKDVKILISSKDGLNGLNIQTGIEKDYDNLKYEELLNVYFCGIFLGIVPMIIVSYVFSIWYLLFGLLYLLSIQTDLKNIFTLVKRGRV